MDKYQALALRREPSIVKHAVPFQRTFPPLPVLVARTFRRPAVNAYQFPEIVEGLTNSSSSQDDPRQNWPYYFQSLCKCNGNYGGYDCGECIFGKTGDSCTKTTIITRKEIGSLTDEERDTYLAALKMAKSSEYTRFMAIKKETSPPQIVQLSLYNLFVWMHYYTGRENDLLRRPRADLYKCVSHRCFQYTVLRYTACIVAVKIWYLQSQSSH